MRLQPYIPVFKPPGEPFFVPLEPDSPATDSRCLGLRLSAVMNEGRWEGGGGKVKGEGGGEGGGREEGTGERRGRGRGGGRVFDTTQ